MIGNNPSDIVNNPARIVILNVSRTAVGSSDYPRDGFSRSCRFGPSGWCDLRSGQRGGSKHFIPGATITLLEQSNCEVIAMTTVAEILAEPEIKEFCDKNDNLKAEVERAAEKQKDKHDAVKSVKKVLPALAENAISVFFSYKKKDEAAAEAVVKTLREYSAGKLDITYQAEFTEEIAGQKWRDKIRESVRPANWFVLLLPNESDDWDWCLFETGQFEAQRTSADRLICLHHPDTKIPSEIEDYHAVAATPAEVEKFLRMVYVVDDPVPGMLALNPALKEKVPVIAQEIVKAIRPLKKTLVREVFEPWVELRIEHPESLSSQEDLDSARVADANEAALDLFGFLRPPGTWQELRSEVLETSEDTRWRDELFHVLRRIASDRKFYPVQAVFKTNDGRMHRPVACAVDRVGKEGPIDTFHITFSEEIAAVDKSAIPKDLAMLAELLRFVFRFRWEVLEPFSRPPIMEDDLQRLDNTMRRIRKDWESHHVGTEEEIFGVFEGEHQKRFMEMSVRWRKIMNDEGTGALDQALKNGETEKVAPLLAEFLPMNQEFLEIAADRFADLISGKVELVGAPA
jgi:hypothetical protein